MNAIKTYWWKILALVLMFYTFIFGFVGKVPVLPILEESIRNLYFHVAMWLVMMLCFFVAVCYSVRYLHKGLAADDLGAWVYVRLGLLSGFLGIITGMIWAKHTWGAYWSNDPKQIGALVALLIYLAYMMLRQSVADKSKVAKLAAVYNIFSFAMLFPTVWILPRMVDSLHPGGMGNPAFNTEDIDGRMRMVFYPAVLGWSLLFVWIAQIELKIRKNVTTS